VKYHISSNSFSCSISIYLGLIFTSKPFPVCYVSMKQLSSFSSIVVWLSRPCRSVMPSTPCDMFYKLLLIFSFLHPPTNLCADGKIKQNKQYNQKSFQSPSQSIQFKNPFPYHQLHFAICL